MRSQGDSALGPSREPTRNGPPPEPICFGDYELDFARRELRRGGEPVDVRPTPLRVLLYLVEHRDRTVPRDELINAVWPSVAVSDQALTTALAEARSAVGDDGVGQRVIRTRKGAGYRFVATDASARLRARRRRWLLPGVLAVVVGSGALAAFLLPRERAPAENGAPTIAILPFTNLTKDAAGQRLADGLGSEIPHALAIEMFNVVAPTSTSTSMPGADVREVGRSLGASHVLEGTVATSEHGPRVTAQLIAVDTGRAIWSELYEPGIHDSSQIQQVIARRVVARVNEWNLASAMAASIPSRWEADQIRRASLEHTGGKFAESVETLEELLASNPDNFVAHAYAVWALSALVDFGSGEYAEVAPRIESHARAALALAPNEGFAAYAAALAHRRHWRWEAAERDGRKACSRTDRVAFCSQLIRTLAATGRAEEALDFARQAVGRSPTSVLERLALARALFAVGLYPDADRECADTNVLPYWWGSAFCAHVLWELGRRDEAAKLARREYEFAGLATIAEHLAALQSEGGPEAVWRAIATNPSPLAYDPYRRHSSRALFLAQLGDQAAALGELEAAVATKDGWLADYLAFRIFDPVRDQSRFGAVVESVGLTEYHAKYLIRERVATSPEMTP